MARRRTRKSRLGRKRSRAGATGALAKLTVRRPLPHGGYGWVRDLPDDRDFVYGAPLIRFPQGLPPSVDLRSECPAVYDQGQLGSCTANGIGAAIEFDQRKQGTREFTPSRLFIYYNERVIEGTVNQDAGAQIRDGIKAVAQLGAPPEDDWSYDISKFSQRPPANAYSDAKQDLVTIYARASRRCAAALPRVIPLCSALRFIRALKAKPSPRPALFRCRAPMSKSWEDTASSP